MRLKYVPQDHQGKTKVFLSRANFWPVLGSQLE